MTRNEDRTISRDSGIRQPLGWLALSACLLHSTLAASDATQLEAEGDRLARQAAVAYRQAFTLYGQTERSAAKTGDRAGSRRAARLRSALSANLLDPVLYRKMSTPGEGPARARSVRVSDSARVDIAQLGKLERLLDAAKLGYRKQPGHEPRDIPLIYELSSLVATSHGDLQQARADRAFEAALRLVRAARSSRAGAEVDAALRVRTREVRLLHKLRRFEEAWRSAQEDPIDTGALGDRDAIAHLRVLESLAMFLEKRGDLARIHEKLQAGYEQGPRGEENPRPRAGFRSLRAGSSRADLAGAFQGCVALLDGFRHEPRERALTIWAASLLALELGRARLAEDLLRTAPALPADQPWLAASLDVRAGLARDQLGDYEAALDSLEQARARLQASDDIASFRARIDIARARAWLGLGRPVEAAQAVETLLAQKSRLSQEILLRARATLAAALYERAREEPRLLDDTLRAYRAIAREVESAPGAEQSAFPDRGRFLLELRIQIANVLRRQAQQKEDDSRGTLLAEAMAMQDAVLRAASEDKDWELAMIAASNVGELKLESGDLDGAESFVRWALEQARAEGRFETEWRCEWYLGRIASARGQAKDVDRHFERATELVEAYRERVFGAEAKSGFLSNKLDLYRDRIRWELSRKRPDRALELAERARARALVETLGWRYVRLANPDDTRRWNELVQLASREQSAREGAARVLGVRGKSEDLASLREQLAAAKKQLLEESDSPLLRSLLDGAPATSAEIVRWLPEGSCLLEYFALGDGLVAFVVTGDTVRVQPLGVRHAELRPLVRRFRAGGAMDDALARKLHAALVEPLDGLIEGRRVICVRYGALEDLPFEALRGPSGYLIERWSLSYLPSASLLRSLSIERTQQRVDAKRWKLLALADPSTDYDGDGRPSKALLSGARDEVEGFSGRFADRVVLSGAEAREADLRQLVRGREVLHFACHGEFDPRNPWLSKLYLAPGGEPAPTASGTGPVGMQSSSDGLLEAYEVSSLDLRGNRLIALSGCETGRSYTGEGQDPVGIGAAFLHGGASALLVSLWKVEDLATAQLMKTFYANWMEQGMDGAEALRQAKLAMLRGPLGRPRQWAAFVYVGDAGS